MSSKVKMDSATKQKCSAIINTAVAAAVAAGAIPIPLSDTIPITAAQIGMIVSLGKVFDLNLSESASKSIINVTIAQGAGRAVFASLLKAIPGAGTVVGGLIAASTAGSITAALGWLVADDFFRISKGEQPQDIVKNFDLDGFTGLFAKK